MATSVKVHVNGRYRATVTHKNAAGEIVTSATIHGNYEGSPNPSGEETFHLQHPARGTFDVVEEVVPEDANRLPPNIDRNAAGPGSVQDAQQESKPGSILGI